MDSKEIYAPEISEYFIKTVGILQSAYTQSYYTEKLQKLDIGIEYVGGHVYKITNSKKWLLAKIKYGF